jgi:hypothetical protein
MTKTDEADVFVFCFAPRIYVLRLLGKFAGEDFCEKPVMQLTLWKSLPAVA